MRRRGWLVAALLGCGGCMGLKLPTDLPADLLATYPAPPVGVKHQGGKLLATDEATLPPAELLNRIRSAAAAGEARRVELAAVRHPDAALETLRTVATPTDPAVKALAAAYDAACVVEKSAGWAAYLADQAANPKKYEAWTRARAAFVEHTRAGKHAEAVASKLADAAPRGVHPAALDAAHLTAAAALAANQPKAAVAALAPVRATLMGHPHQGAYLLLLLSEAERRAGNEAEANSRWAEAVSTAAGMLAGADAVVDPVLWDRCAYLRPSDHPWPDVARGALAKAAGFPAPSAVVPAGGGAGEPLVWACVGKSRLKRGEAQLALPAFKQAEAWTTDPAARAALQLSEAQALIEVGQGGAATAVLSKLVAEPGPQAAQAAALLGAVLLQAKQAKQAAAVLRKALDEGGEWPTRAQAEANLGLALLVLGDQPEGLRWTHAAQQRYEAAGDQAQLRQSLENEAGYLERVGDRAGARAVRQRLAGANGSASRPP